MWEIKNSKAVLIHVYFLVETNQRIITKMFSYTVLFITPTYFGPSCDHLQGVVKWVYKQYVSDYIKFVRKIFM
jgi:hypothetical protein